MTCTGANPSFECDGVRLWAQCRQLAIVVKVSGDIDDTTVDCVSGAVNRYVLAEKPFILDLSGLNSFSAQSISLLYTLDEACCAAGVEWSLVANEAIVRLLRTTGDNFPLVGSVPEALHHFSDNILERRRLLPLLTKKTA